MVDREKLYDVLCAVSLGHGAQISEPYHEARGEAVTLGLVREFTAYELTPDGERRLNELTGTLKAPAGKDDGQ